MFQSSQFLILNELSFVLADVDPRMLRVTIGTNAVGHPLENEELTPGHVRDPVPLLELRSVLRLGRNEDAMVTAEETEDVRRLRVVTVVHPRGRGRWLASR